MNINDHILAFKAFADSFRNGKGTPYIELKRDHSLRVLNNAEVITADPDVARRHESAGPSGGMLRLSLLAALYHDVGRFPQYAEYGTFSDSRSVNHGMLGVKAIRSGDMLADLRPDERKVVQVAVGLHNRRFLPPRLPERIALATGVVRDADKLDILPVMRDQFTGSSTVDTVVTLGLDDNPEGYTPEVADCVLEKRLSSYGEMRFVNDFKLLVMSWVWDCNFPVTLRLIRERGDLEAVMKTLPNLPRLNLACEKVREVLAEA